MTARVGRNAIPGHDAAESDRHAAGQHRRHRAGAEVGRLAVAQVATVGPVGQGVRQAHDAGVERRHDERPGPASGRRVAVDRHEPAQPVRGRRWPGADPRTAPPCVGGSTRTGRRARGGRSPSARAVMACWRAESMVPPEKPPLSDRTSSVVSASVPSPSAATRWAVVEDAEVGGDGVEAAGVHDGRAGLPRPGVELVEGPPDEEHLTGEVGVVRPRLGAGASHLLAVRRVRADRRGEHARARRRARGGRVRRSRRRPPAPTRQRPDRARRAGPRAWDATGPPGRSARRAPHAAARWAAVRAPTKPVAP